MKRSIVIVICLISLLSMVSCGIDDEFAPKPSLRFVEEEGLIYQNSVIPPGETLLFKVEVAPNDTANKALSSYSFMIFDLNHSSTDPVYENKKTFEADDYETHVFNESYTPNEAAYLRAVATVTDVENVTNELQLVIDVLEPGIQLGSYEGNLTAEGILHSDFIFLDSVAMNVPINTTVYLDSIAGKNRLRATFILDGFPITVECNRNGNTLTFDELTFNDIVNHVEDIEIAFKANLSAEIHTTGNTLVISGTLLGSGNTIGYTNMTHVDWVNGKLHGTLSPSVKPL